MGAEDKTKEPFKERLNTASLTAENKKAWAESVLNAISDAISIQDTDFKYLYQNQLHKNLFGNHIGEYCYTVIHGRDRVCEKCQLAMSFKDGGIYRLEQSRMTDKGIQYAEITASPLKNSSGKIIAGIEVVRDVTGCKKVLEESRRREAEITELHKSSSAVLKYRKFEDAARSIFDSCKNLIEATAGYVALLSNDGLENEVLVPRRTSLHCGSFFAHAHTRAA